jgi:hypothetical protein
LRLLLCLGLACAAGGALAEVKSDWELENEIGLRFRFQELGPAHLPLGIELTDSRLLIVRQASRHRSARHEDGGEVAEGERRHEQPGHDLVADAEKDRGVEHVVGQRNARTHGDHVAREQRQLHAG